MVRSKKVEIWMQVVDHNPILLEVCRDMDSAVLKVERYEHEDEMEKQNGYNVPDVFYILKRKEA